MKHLSLLVYLLPFILYSQTWQPTSITPNTNGQRFDDVFFINDNIGWAANGYYAAVFKTTDGGNTWTEQVSSSDLGGSYYFRNIEFINENIGFLGTLNGKFFSTNDGGTTWTEVTNISPNPQAICGIDAVGTSTIYGCGAYFSPACIIKSTDSGVNWQYIDMSAYATALVEIFFADESTGYACGRNANGACILKTTDGGSTWTELFNSNIPGEYVWKFQILENAPNVFFGAISSIAPNPGKLIKSVDSGTTWNSYDAPETDVQAVGFINENKGWMGGHTTGFYETVDGGQTWTNLNVGSNLNRIFVISPALAYASGTSIYKFTDASLNISEVESNSKTLDIHIKNNPVDTTLEFSIYFHNNDNLLIELYDSKGTFIKQLSREIITATGIEKHYAFDVSELSSGTYFLNLHNNFQRESIKFIKQ